MELFFSSTPCASQYFFYLPKFPPRLLLCAIAYPRAWPYIVLGWFQSLVTVYLSRRYRCEPMFGILLYYFYLMLLFPYLSLYFFIFFMSRTGKTVGGADQGTEHKKYRTSRKKAHAFLCPLLSVLRFLLHTLCLISYSADCNGCSGNAEEKACSREDI